MLMYSLKLNSGHNEPSPTNTVQSPCAIDAVAHCIIGNFQGGYYFLCLTACLATDYFHFHLADCTIVLTYCLRGR
jgi:hypothetical protein